MKYALFVLKGKSDQKIREASVSWNWHILK